MSQTGKQIITKHILPNISRGKGNQAKKLGQLKKYNVRNIFLQKSCINEAVTLVPNFFLFFKRALKKVQTNVELVGFNCFGISPLVHTIKKIYKASDYSDRDIFFFDIERQMGG